jgi:UDP-N-acetylglucosamine kinase
VEVAILAFSEAGSRLSILARYLEQRRDRGHGRLTGRAKHDASSAGILAASDLIDQERLADTVAVYRRGNRLVYSNQLTPEGAWARPAATHQAINTERGHSWSHAETAEFTRQLLHLAKELGPDWHAELADIVTLARPLLERRSRLALIAERGAPTTMRFLAEHTARVREERDRSDGPER